MTDLDDFLGASPSETRGLLLDLCRRQAAARRPRDVLRQWNDDGSVSPSPMDLRSAVAFDALVLDAAAEYEALLLSPVAPLAVNAAVAPTSQDRTLSTTRATEVVSDPTNVLAVEAARRVMSDPTRDVRLCTVHQTLRMQDAGSVPGRTRHFRLFAMADAGARQPDDGFEVDAVLRQLGVIDRFLDACEQRGFAPRDRQVVVRTAPHRAALAGRIESALREGLPHITVTRDDFESTYYDGLRVGLSAIAPDGQVQELADLGAFDWVSSLTSNARWRFVASGLGMQLVPLLFPSALQPDS